MYEMIELVNEILPTDKPRYLMGGTPLIFWKRIERGVDMFDCVMPMKRTKWQIFTKDGIMNT